MTPTFIIIEGTRSGDPLLIPARTAEDVVRWFGVLSNKSDFPIPLREWLANAQPGDLCDFGVSAVMRVREFTRLPGKCYSAEAM